MPFNLDRYNRFLNVGEDNLFTSTHGTVTAIIKPVRNQVTGEIQRGPYEAYRRQYGHRGKPPDKKGA